MATAAVGLDREKIRVREGLFEATDSKSPRAYPSEKMNLTPYNHQTL